MSAGIDASCRNPLVTKSQLTVARNPGKAKIWRQLFKKQLWVVTLVKMPILVKSEKRPQTPPNTSICMVEYHMSRFLYNSSWFGRRITFSKAWDLTGKIQFLISSWKLCYLLSKFTYSGESKGISIHPWDTSEPQEVINALLIPSFFFLSSCIAPK